MISDHFHYRIYEILPGLSIWLTLTLTVFLSILKPLWMIYFIIIFDIYWVLRVLYFALYTILSWRRYYLAIKIDWFSRLRLEIPDWAKKINVVFLPLYNENWWVVK